MSSMRSTPYIHIYSRSDDVTGSCSLVTAYLSNKKTIRFLVDCGAFQGQAGAAGRRQDRYVRNIRGQYGLRGHIRRLLAGRGALCRRGAGSVRRRSFREPCRKPPQYPRTPACLKIRYTYTGNRDQRADKLLYCLVKIGRSASAGNGLPAKDRSN